MKKSKKNPKTGIVQEIGSADLHFDAYGIESAQNVHSIETWTELLEIEFTAYLRLEQFADELSSSDSDLQHELVRRRAFLLSICTKNKKPPR